MPSIEQFNNCGEAKCLDEAMKLLEAYAEENKRLKRCLNPRLWTQSMSDAWHKAIPDLQAAFEALSKEPGQ